MPRNIRWKNTRGALKFRRPRRTSPVRRIRVTIAVLLLGMSLLSVYLAAVAQDAPPWPPPVKPLPPGTMEPTIIPVRGNQEIAPPDSPGMALPPDGQPIPVEPGPANGPGPVLVTTPEHRLPLAPSGEVRGTEAPAPKPPWHDTRPSS